MTKLLIITTVMLIGISSALLRGRSDKTLKSYKPEIRWNKLMDGFNEEYKTDEFAGFKR